MKPDYDVIIIGAGPAGACCAKRLVDNNIKVLVLERSALLRYKACAGLISKRALAGVRENFGAIPESMQCTPSRVGIKVAKRGNAFITVPGRDLLSIKRHEFDYWLIGRSAAEVWEKTTYKKHRHTGGLIELAVASGGKAAAVTCRWLVGADGGWSTVRKNIDPGFNKNNFLVSRQFVYTGESRIDPSWYHFLLDKQYSDLVGWFTVKNGLIYIGASCKRRSPKDCFSALYDTISRDYDLRAMEKVRMESCLTDARFSKDRFFFGTGNVLLVGEASGLLNGFGEGIAAALNAGKIAAQSILDAETGSGDAGDLYSRNIEPEKLRTVNELQMRL